MTNVERIDVGRTHRRVALALAVASLCGSVARSGGSVPAGAVDGSALGRAYVPVLAASYADGWTAAARAVEQGKTVAEAQKALQQAWKESRVKSFKEGVQPAFSLVLAEGAEPADPTQRAQVVKLWRDFARGLRGGR